MNGNSNIINSWLEYIKVENREKHKVDLRDLNIKQCVYFEQIVDKQEKVFIQIKKETIEVLRKKYPIKVGSDGLDENKLFLFLFPISVNKNNRETLYPLFAFDVTDQKSDMFSRGDSDSIVSLSVYSGMNYSPMADIFAYYLKINKEEYFRDNIPFVGLLDKIIGRKHDDFLDAFESMEEYCQRNLSYGKYEAQYSGYFSGDVGNRFTESLENDLSVLRDLELSSDELAYKYLHNQSTDEGEISTGDNIWVGSFNAQYALSSGQAKVLSTLNSGKRQVAVQGAPGTGKTTLFLNIVANQITKRAIRLAKDLSDENNLMLVVSTTNKAVDNVIDGIKDDSFLKDISWLYFVGGEVGRINSSTDKARQLINKIRAEKYDEQKHHVLRDDIIQMNRSLTAEVLKYDDIKNIIERIFTKYGIDDINHLEEYLESSRAEVDTISGYVVEALNLDDSMTDRDILLSLQKALEETQQYLVFKESILGKKVDFSDFIENSSRIAAELEALKISISMVPAWKMEAVFKERASLYSKYLIDGSKKGHILKDLSLEDGDFRNLDVLIEAVSSLQTKLVNLENYPHKEVITNRYNEWKKAGKVFSQNIDFIDDISKDLDIVKNINIDDFNSVVDYYRKNYVQESRLIFEKSIEFLWQEILSKKSDIVFVIEQFLLLIGSGHCGSLGDIDRRMARSEFWETLSLVYPVMTTTIHSYNNFFKCCMYKDEERGNFVNTLDKVKPIDLILSDESGMTPLHTIFPILYRAKRSIIVGDPRQLEPIVSISEIVGRRFNEDNFSSFEEGDMYSPVSVTAYHRSAGCSDGKYDSVGNGIVLNEHRRCQPDIAKLFMKIAGYHGVEIKTGVMSGVDRDKLNFVNGNNIAIYNVEGALVKNKRNTNYNEIRKIDELLEILSKNGFNMKKDVAIITPYLAQEEELIRSLGRKIGHNYKTDIKIGTVHKFQGSEFKVVIFSPVIFEAEHSSIFINSSPNMINVAVSRAQVLYVVVGNLRKMVESGSYLREMVDYICEKGIMIES